MTGEAKCASFLLDSDPLSNDYCLQQAVASEQQVPVIPFGPRTIHQGPDLQEFFQTAETPRSTATFPDFKTENSHLPQGEG